MNRNYLFNRFAVELPLRRRITNLELELHATRQDRNTFLAQRQLLLERIQQLQLELDATRQNRNTLITHGQTLLGVIQQLDSTIRRQRATSVNTNNYRPR